MIGMEPVELMMSNTEPVLKYVHEDLVAGHIKSRAKIEQYQHGNETMVDRIHDVIVNNYDGSFCEVVLSIGRLTFRKTVLSCVITYMINNNTLDYLGDEAQIWDGFKILCHADQATAS